MVSYLGQKYRHFQTAEASTTFVLGEFPWQVRVGEAATVSDYISPPRVISSEQTGNEITWSMGEYMAGRDVWKAFNLPGEPPQAIGVYENQPSPLSGIVTSIWLAFSALLLGLVVVLIVCTLLARDQQVFVGDYVFNTNARAGEPSFVSDIFELQGHSSNVEVSTDTNVNNSWIYLNYALINQDTGQAFDFGREVSYYHGYDSDGAWSEGKSKDTVIVPEVPPGHYYLRVEPESDRGLGLIRYSITVRRDVPNYLFYLLAFVALLIPAILLTWRSLSFEHLRWAESDYAPSGGD
jgi:hypothetical protein